MLTKGQKKKIKISILASIFILAGLAGIFIYLKNKDHQKTAQISLRGIIMTGNDLEPPRDYCKNGQYLVSQDGQPLFQNKSVIQLRNESGQSPIKNINKYLKEEVFIDAAYEQNKDLCLALMCSCEDFITVKSIKLKTEKTLGYIKEFSDKNNRKYVNFLTAEWLTSLDGTCTMTEDEKNFPDLPVCNYNGFLIIKTEVEKEIKTSPDIAVFMQTLNHATSGDYLWDEKISLEKLKQIIKHPRTNREAIYQEMPFWFEIENSEIKKITEQYLP